MAFGLAGQLRALNEDMPRARLASTAAQQHDEVITGCAAGLGGAGMAGPAAFVDLARRNSCQADPRAFSTPNRPVAIPNAGGRAGERLAARHDSRGLFRSGTSAGVAAMRWRRARAATCRHSST